MRAVLSILTLAVICGSAGYAQQWTMGGAAGGGFYHFASVSNGTGSVQAGAASQVAAGIVVGDDAYDFIGGEFRYTYRGGDFQLKGNGTTASMSGNSHALHYDFLCYARPRGSRVRPFAAGGGGAKLYWATGKEQAFQPLSNFALLTKTRQWEWLASFGGGVKATISRHAEFRADFRDYLTPFPNRVITPAPGAKTHGWFHDLVPMAGVSYVF